MDKSLDVLVISDPWDLFDFADPAQARHVAYLNNHVHVETDHSCGLVEGPSKYLEVKW